MKTIEGYCTANLSKDTPIDEIGFDENEEGIRRRFGGTRKAMRCKIIIYDEDECDESG